MSWQMIYNLCFSPSSTTRDMSHDFRAKPKPKDLIDNSILLTYEEEKIFGILQFIQVIENCYIVYVLTFNNFIYVFFCNRKPHEQNVFMLNAGALKNEWGNWFVQDIEY